MDQPADLHQLFETHRVFVSRLARAMVAEEHAAEDLAHETWAAVVRRPPVGVRNMRAWLSTILGRRVVAHRRRSRTGVDLDAAQAQNMVDASATAEEAAQQLEVEHKLQSAVRALVEPYQSTIYLRFHEGLAPREIAARSGVPVSTVKTRLARGLDQLRAALDGDAAEMTHAHRNWRLALAPVAGLQNVASKAPSPASTVLATGKAPAILLGMKKLIMAAAALLLAIGLYARLSPPSAPGTARSEGTGGVPLEAPLREAPETLSRPAAQAERQDVAAAQVEPSQAASPEPRAEASVIVHVRDARGAAVEGRPILLKVSSWLNAGHPPVLRRTDAEGRVVFSGLKVSDYVVADAHGGEDQWLELEPGETRTLRWTLEDDVTVLGQVLDAQGKPVPGADIWCAASPEVGKQAWPIASAGPDGRFALRCPLGAGLLASGAGFLSGSLRSVQALPEVEQGVREVELLLERGGSSLAGRVIDALGQPVTGAHVTVELAHPRAAISAVDGRFQVGGALPLGEHFVVVRAAGFAPLALTARIEDGPNELELVLHEGVVVSGIVLRPDGSPASKAHVWVASPESGWQVYGHGDLSSTRCDAQGRFTLASVGPGWHALRAQAGWADPTAQAQVLIEVSGDDVRDRELQLDFGRTIAGRVVDHEGLSVSGVVVTALSGSVRSKDARSSEDGSFRLTALPEPEDGPEGQPGQWELVARAWTGTSVRVLGRLAQVESNGDDVELVVERIEQASGSIIGRIEADSSPIPGDVQARLVDEDGGGGAPLAFDPNTGAFDKGPLRPGTYRIELSKGGVPAGTTSGLVLKTGETLDAGVLRVGASKGELIPARRAR